jgi:hypothetical protein
MRVLRWILLPVVFIAAWLAAAYVGFLPRSAVESLFPGDPGFEPTFPWLNRFLAAFIAASIIVSCYFTAPAFRTVVAWVAFAAHAAFYILGLAMGVPTAEEQAIPAAIGGLATVLLLTRRKNLFRGADRVAPQNA